MMTILTSVRWHLVVLLCVSLLTSGVKRLFMYIHAIGGSSLDNYLFRSSIHFLIGQKICCLFIYLYEVLYVIFIWGLYILKINSMSVTSFANILSQLSFHFVYGFFCYAKIYKFNKSSLLAFAFISFALRDWLKKTVLRFMPENVLPIFSSSSLASWLIFKSLMTLSLFLCMVEEVF